MRIVATSDTHKPFTNELIPDGDVFLHVGDLMYTGYVDEWYPMLESLKALPHKTKILVPGNHDFHIQNYEGVAAAELRKAGVTMIWPRHPIFELNKVKFLGLPFVTGISGWAFCRTEEWVKDYLEHITEKVDVVASHAPPWHMRDAIYPEKLRTRDQEHVGCMAYNRWINGTLIPENRLPKHWFCGHIHESYGSQNFGELQVHNVAMCNRSYQQVNPALIIDI